MSKCFRNKRLKVPLFGKCFGTLAFFFLQFSTTHKRYGKSATSCSCKMEKRSSISLWLFVGRMPIVSPG